MQSILRVIGIQANLVWENAEKNRLFFQKIIDALTDDVDLIVLPEMFSTGFSMHPSLLAEEMNGTTISWMKKIAKQKDTAIIGSLIIKENDKFYNRSVFVHPTEKVDIYDKRHSFSLAGEDKVYTSGSKRIIIDYKGWKICPLICYDLRFPVWSRNTENFDILLFMANWPVPRIKAWNTLLKARAIENMCYVVGVNRVGEDTNKYQYSGNSVIVDYFGDEIATLKDSEAGIVTAVLHKENQDKARKKLPFLNDKDDFIIQ